MKMTRLFLAPVVFLLTTTLAQADLWEALPDDLLLEITNRCNYETLEKLARESPRMFQYTSGRPSPLSKWSVKLGNDWIWFHQALKANAPIVAWKDLDFILAQTMAEEPWAFRYILSKLPTWDAATKQAAWDGKEPSYLQTISTLSAIMVRQSITSRLSALSTTKDLISFAFSLLFAMRDYNGAAFDAAKYAAKETAGDAAREATRATAWHTANKAAYDATMDPVFQAAMATLYGDLIYSATVDATWLAAHRVARQACSRSEEAKTNGKLAQRITEKAVLVYFVQHAAGILPACQGALARLQLSLATSHFASQEAWQKFKAKYFEQVLSNPEEAHFLNVWLDELDRTVQKIEEMEG